MHPAALGGTWATERTLHRDDDLWIVDKPPGIPVHGGSPDGVGDLVTRLAGDRGQSVRVHQRLDLGTSGAIAFATSAAGSARLAPLFEEHRAGRVYLAAVSDPGLAAIEILEHRLSHEHGVTRVVRRGGQLARARCTVVARGAGRALVELRPETGRTHQLRVQLATRGAPIAGDREYGGAPAWRPYLHAAELDLDGTRVVAPAPEEFAAWVRGEDLVLGSEARVRARMRDAAWLRQPLGARASALRWCNDAGDGLPGVTVDRYDDWAVLALGDDAALARQGELARVLIELGARGVYLKARARTDLRRANHAELAPRAPLLGEPAPAELVVHEGELRAAVSLGDGLSTGLFVDQRDNRARVREWTRARPGARVLNLFAYTCGFSVAAAQGGAAEVTSVDLSRRALERGRRNFELSGVSASASHRFFAEDAAAYLARARRRGERFDVIVLDPPTFGSAGKRKLDVASDLPRLAEDALALLGAGGRLLLVTNHRGTSSAALRRAVQRAAESASVPLAQVKDLASGADCPAWFGGPWPSKSLVATRS